MCGLLTRKVGVRAKHKVNAIAAYYQRQVGIIAMKLKETSPVEYSLEKRSSVLLRKNLLQRTLVHWLHLSINHCALPCVCPVASAPVPAPAPP